MTSCARGRMPSRHARQARPPRPSPGAREGSCNFTATRRAHCRLVRCFAAHSLMRASPCRGESLQNWCPGAPPVSVSVLPRAGTPARRCRRSQRCTAEVSPTTPPRPHETPQAGPAGGAAAARAWQSALIAGEVGNESGRFRMFSNVASRFAPRKGVKPYSSSYIRMPKLHLPPRARAVAHAGRVASAGRSIQACQLGPASAEARRCHGESERGVSRLPGRWRGCSAQAPERRCMLHACWLRASPLRAGRHQSTAAVWPTPLMISGARYSSVPTNELARPSGTATSVTSSAASSCGPGIG